MFDLCPDHHRTLSHVARTAIRAAVAGRKPDPVQNSDQRLLQPAGCFVSLHDLRPRRLRGCIGSFEAGKPMIHIVHEMAVAVLQDPRFAHLRVREQDIPSLEIEISLLSPLRPAPGPLDFDLLNDGIHLSCHGRTGCFLPQVARETGWIREQLLSRLCTEKMGLQPEAWKHPGAVLEIFSILVVGPEPFE
ncbi:MAG TPA: AmmeMemoRadiSam system protein A [Tepidisphaeraceae bacterium]